MRKGVVILLVVMVIANLAFAQKGKNAVENQQVKVPVTEPGKGLTETDSTMITQLFFSALREKTIENFTLAAEYFGHIIKIDPDNDASMYELAKIRQSENNETSARDLLEKAVKISPGNKYYWLALVDSYEKTNDVEKLDHAYDQLINIDPDNDEYLYGKANVLYVEKKYSEALAVYKEIEDVDGLNDNIIANRQKIYLKQGNITAATAEMEQMITDHPDVVKYYLLLSELYSSNNYDDKALLVLLKAEKLNSGNATIHLALADIYKDKKDYQASFDQIRLAFQIPDLNIDEKIRILLGYIPKFPDPDAKASALELSRILTIAHPNDAKAYAIYGNMLLQNDDYADAKTVLKKAVVLNSQVYDVWEQLIRIEISTNQADEAAKDGEEALSYFPNQAWLNYLVGVAFVQKKDYKKALGYASNVASLETQDKSLLSQSYSLLGDCYHSLNDISKSDEAYDKSLSYDADNAYTLNNFAYYLCLRGEQLDKAAQMSQHSNDLQPNNSSFEDTFAWILFKEKKYTEARTWIEKALVDDKTKSAVQIEHYGDIMYYLGDVDAALQNWKKAKQFGEQSAILDRKINEKKYVE